MIAKVSCVSATQTRVEFRLKPGDPANSDYGNLGCVLVFSSGHGFGQGEDYSLTISPEPGPGGAPMRRAKLACVSANVLPNGQFQATLRIVAGDVMNAGLGAVNLVISVISSQQFTNGSKYVLDLDPA